MKLHSYIWIHKLDVCWYVWWLGRTANLYEYPHAIHLFSTMWKEHSLSEVWNLKNTYLDEEKLLNPCDVATGGLFINYQTTFSFMLEQTVITRSAAGFREVQAVALNDIIWIDITTTSNSIPTRKYFIFKLAGATSHRRYKGCGIVMCMWRYAHQPFRCPWSSVK